MLKTTTDKILMIRPKRFGYNEETAKNNFYQKKDINNPDEIIRKALIEFDKMVDKLRKNGIEVIVLEDREEFYTPDSIFPNNWFSTHSEGKIFLYPMFAKNRRLERREDIYNYIENIDSVKIVDYTEYEKENLFLEGTGSIIFDRKNKKAYLSISERSNEKIFDELCKNLNYKKIIFNSYQSVGKERKPIYHTNVMMSIGENYAIICADSIDNQEEREKVIEELRIDNKNIIFITENQVENFLGNTLELKNKEGKYFIVMSTTAYKSLTVEQLIEIEKTNTIIPVSIPTIEKYGGGSARCMMAEIFL